MLNFCWNTTVTFILLLTSLISGARRTLMALSVYFDGYNLAFFSCFLYWCSFCTWTICEKVFGCFAKFFGIYLRASKKDCDGDGDGDEDSDDDNYNNNHDEDGACFSLVPRKSFASTLFVRLFMFMFTFMGTWPKVSRGTCLFVPKRLSAANSFKK